MQFRFRLWSVWGPLAMAALLGLFPPQPAVAQAPDAAGNGKLESVRVTGSAKFHSEQIAPATGLTPGATISKDDLQQGADRLVRSGLFAKVQYRYETLDTGVRAEYQVADAPALPVWFDNFPWFTDDELIAAIKHEAPLFDGTAPDHGTFLDDVSTALEKIIATRGVHSTVSHVVATAPTSNQQVQSFHVENPGLNIAAIEFSDPLAQSDHAVQQRLADLIGKPYSRTTIELFESEQIRPAYISRSFLRVKFGAPSPHILGEPGNPRLTVVVPIEPGPAFAWNELNWRGNWAISPADLDKLVGLKSGDPADGMKIESALQSVRDAYARRGYLDVDVSVSPQFDDSAKRVTYSATITEGPQYHMGRLVLSGLSVDSERRIRAGWKIPEGAVFDKGVYDDFLSSGITQALTGLPFHYDKIGRFLQQDAPNATVDVMLDFQ